MSTAAERLSPVVRTAHAKINLTLAVVGRRSDGFHELHSVMAPIGLADRVSVAVRPPGPRVEEDTLHVTGFDPGPSSENLVLRAIAAARAHVRPAWPGAPAVPPPLAVRLEKHIPIAAGLAGGSSDAAAAIDAALEAWGVALSDAERTAVAASVGSDVPFALVGGPALVEGRGERVTPLPGLRGMDAPGAIVVTPALGVSTRAAFAAYDAGARPSDAASTLRTSRHLADELRTDTLGTEQLVARAGVLATANDLLPAATALVPALGPFRRSVGRFLGRPAAQSGSGPTVFVLYPSAHAAEADVAALREALGAGTLEAPGDGPPFVVATTVVVRARGLETGRAAAEQRGDRERSGGGR